MEKPLRQPVPSDDLKPSERFARLAKTVFGVKREEVDRLAKENPLPPQKRGRKPKKAPLDHIE